jgi:hypothetical protein
LYRFFLASLLSFFFLLFSPVPSLHAIEKTPNDVFTKILVIRSQVEKIRALHHIDSPWPVVPPQTNKTPSHVLQKCFEVMEKINRLRRIEKLGEITIPSYPARNITPNEVYDLVERLEQEFWLVLAHRHDIPPYYLTSHSIPGKTPNDVYRELWAISYALNPLLGMRGVSPNDAYALSELILAEIRFLRNSQNLIGDIPPPSLSKGHHPNHTLQTASTLLTTIARAQENLWLTPAVPNPVPRRVITASDVYDGLLGILAELQRIKYRLGLERVFPLPKTNKRYDSDDIIRNLQWAKELMPLFPLDQSLLQYDQSSLVKSPSHVFQIADHILWELQKYKHLLGIRETVAEEAPVEGLVPQHIYGKILECLRQVSLLRSNRELGPIAISSPPLRTITPDEVFDLVTRLDMELEILYTSGHVTPIPWFEDDREFISGKTSSDVYNKVRTIAREIDILLGSRGYSPDDSYMLAEDIQQELILILTHLNVAIAEQQVPTPSTPQHPRRVLSISHELWELLKTVQRRAGIQSPFIPSVSPAGTTTPTDIYNELQLILTEIRGLKLHLEVPTILSPCRQVQGKTPSHVEQNLRKSIYLLRLLLGQKKDEDVSK